jgi:hypothetical protein
MWAAERPNAHLAAYRAHTLGHEVGVGSDQSGILFVRFHLSVALYVVVEACLKSGKDPTNLPSL